VKSAKDNTMHALGKMYPWPLVPPRLVFFQSVRAAVSAAAMALWPVWGWAEVLAAWRIIGAWCGVLGGLRRTVAIVSSLCQATPQTTTAVLQPHSTLLYSTSALVNLICTGLQLLPAPLPVSDIWP
jgi:hypothetical protein